mmetsp:Transcript_32088/g.105051  ORF Transcript_32088/g.105051 Transcript_32088/m.105051 type:complete len:198 (+) Transcript_32088:86-679(+)
MLSLTLTAAYALLLSPLPPRAHTAGGPRCVSEPPDTIEERTTTPSAPAPPPLRTPAPLAADAPPLAPPPPPIGAPRLGGGDSRNALLMAIQQGKPLKKVGQPAAADSKAPRGSEAAPGGGGGDLMQALRARMDVRRKAMGTWGSAGGTLGSTAGTLPAANEFRTDAAVEPPAPPELAHWCEGNKSAHRWRRERRSRR